MQIRFDPVWPENCQFVSPSSVKIMSHMFFKTTGNHRFPQFFYCSTPGSAHRVSAVENPLGVKTQQPSCHHNHPGENVQFRVISGPMV
jgi:hypothetical protein